MILTMPKSPIHKFFMGISWLDPNVRYFRELGKMQAQRTREDMDCWQSPGQIDLALAAGEVFMRCAHWQKPYFFPDDSWDVLWVGPEPFAWLATDSDLDVFEDIGFWLRGLGIVMNRRELGRFLERETFGGFVSAVLTARSSCLSEGWF